MLTTSYPPRASSTYAIIVEQILASSEPTAEQPPASTWRFGLPPVLFHYTTWGGVQGILASQRFWATAHGCTNDEAELISAADVIIEVAKDLLKNATGAAAEALRQRRRVTRRCRSRN